MTVRDWLPIVGALLVPVMIAAGTWWITAQQGKIEDRRAEADRKLAEQRAQDEALQAYLDQMGTLLIKQHLLDSNEHSQARTLARARTLTVLARLDASRKAAVVQFLYEAKLIRSVNGKDPIVSLGGADLRYADFGGADLEDADLGGAYLQNADLRYADLEVAYLGDRADLEDAYLYDADLEDAFLGGAYLSGADLRYADLRNAYLGDADLIGTDLSRADLKKADFSRADLSHADLGNAKGVTGEDLKQQAETLKGATMPDGQKYEDWLKDREKRQQDE
jgi:hypothetical protein